MALFAPLSSLRSTSVLRPLLFLLPLFTWLTACQSARKTSYSPEQIVPKDKALVWKVSGNGLKKPSFVYGTIHLIPKAQYQMPNGAINALDKAKRVAFEIDMKEMLSLRTQLSLMSKAFMAGGKTLKDLLTPEDYAFVREKMAEKGLPVGMLERMKPMFLSMMFSSDEGGGNPLGESGSMTAVEMEVYRIVRKRKLETAGLETAAYQMAIFDSIPYEAQAKMLVGSLRGDDLGETGDGDSQLDRMVKLYRSQDIDAMQAMMGDEDMGIKNYEDILLKQRNRNWIPIMSRMMREKPTLFAVGAGHLGGDQGVVALLRRAGYAVEPVN